MTYLRNAWYLAAWSRELRTSELGLASCSGQPRETGRRRPRGAIGAVLQRSPSLIRTNLPACNS